MAGGEWLVTSCEEASKAKSSGMAFAHRFEELEVWKSSKELSLEIYGHFRNSRDFGFRDQIQRAAVSVMNNIAEGFERRTKQDFARFLD